MATYNGEAFVAEQLASFLDQRRLPDELIVCDDGSSDTTVDIVARFAKSAPFPVDIVRNPARLGFSRNFENALSRCSKDIVLLSDQDDVWHPIKIDRVVDVMAKNESAWVLGHDGRITDRQREWNGVTKMSQIRSAYGTLESFSTGALTAARREFLRDALPVPHEVASHDVWLHRLSGLLPERRILIDDCLQDLRRHDENTSDWVVNSMTPVRRTDILRGQARVRPCVDYGPRIELNRRLRDRLEALALDKAVSIDAAVSVLERERAALLARQALVNSGPVSRRMQAVNMLVHGRYGHFTGIHSFLRDLLR